MLDSDQLCDLLRFFVVGECLGFSEIDLFETSFPWIFFLCRGAVWQARKEALVILVLEVTK